MADDEQQKDATGLRIFPPMAFDDLIYSICAPAALSVLVMFRYGLGFRMVPLWGIVPLFAALFLYANIGLLIGSLFSSTVGTLPFYAFAIAFLILAVKQNRARWAAIKAHDVYHSYSRGGSRLARMFPQFGEEAWQRYVEPVVCLIVAIVLFFVVAWPLPVWLVWSSISLFVCEAVIAEKRKTRMLDLMDSIAAHQHHKRAVAEFTQQHEGAELPPDNEDVGIPTDHETEDIQQALERRRRRQIGGMEANP